MQCQTMVQAPGGADLRHDLRRGLEMDGPGDLTIPEVPYTISRQACLFTAGGGVTWQFAASPHLMQRNFIEGIAMTGIKG